MKKIQFKIMKSFENVYNRSKHNAINEQQKAIAADKAKLVAAIKHEYGVQDFATLVNEAEKESFKAMLAEMWDRESGLTSKGVAFLNESAAVLTEKSTDEQIEKFFKREIKANVDKIVETLVLGKECSFCGELKKKIETYTKKKVSTKTAKQWIFDVCCAFIGQKVKSIKF